MRLFRNRAAVTLCLCFLVLFFAVSSRQEDRNAGTDDLPTISDGVRENRWGAGIQETRRDTESAENRANAEKTGYTKRIWNARSTEASMMENRRVIYLAGGCFWGVEGYFKKLNGVYETTTGYANGLSSETEYRRLHETDHAETVKIEYDRSKISLEELLLHYFRVIDPLSVNRQGNDVGRQYRTGIYYDADAEDGGRADRAAIDRMMEYERGIHGEIAVEVAPLQNFVEAEEYHQDYLDRNPGGYCHIDLGMADRPLFETKAEPLSVEELRKRLTPEEFHIIVNAGTERPYSSPLNEEYRKGIYIDKATKVPLFASKDKFDAGCGWPSFSKPILSDVVEETLDLSHGMTRVEVRSKHSNAHLGHVFEDGPVENGGLRYCINGASLEFVPYEEMEERGYGMYLPLCE